MRIAYSRSSAACIQLCTTAVLLLVVRMLLIQLVEA